MTKLLEDGVRAISLALVGLAMFGAVVLPPRTEPGWLDALGRGLAFLGGQLLAVAVLRRVVPAPRPGAHRPGTDPGHLRWVASCAFAEVMLHPLVRAPFWLLHATRVLYLRALGAAVSWRAFVPPDTVFRDPALVTVGPRSRLEPGVVLESGRFEKGRVRVQAVTVGEDCHLGARVVLLPGVTVGHAARIEPGVIVGEDTRVGVSAWVGAGARIARGVDLGSYTVVGPGAVLGDGVVVGDRARVPAGSVVPPDTKIGEREVYGLESS